MLQLVFQFNSATVVNCPDRYNTSALRLRRIQSLRERKIRKKDTKNIPMKYNGQGLINQRRETFLVQLKFNVSRFKKTHENCHLLGKFRVSRYTRARYLSLSARLPTLFAASFSVFLDLHLGIYLTPRASLSARFIPIPRDSLCPTSLSPFQRPSLSVCLVARLLFPLPCFLPPLFPSVARIRARFPFRCFAGCFARSSLGPVSVFQPVSPVHWSFYFLVQSVLVTLCSARSDTPYANDHTA